MIPRPSIKFEGFTFFKKYIIIIIVKKKGDNNMAAISEEVKVQINELYAEIGVKSRVAKMLGISPASVTKYLIPNYIPIAKRNIKTFDGELAGPQEFIARLLEDSEYFQTCKLLTKEEEEELRIMQKEEI